MAMEDGRLKQFSMCSEGSQTHQTVIRVYRPQIVEERNIHKYLRCFRTLFAKLDKQICAAGKNTRIGTVTLQRITCFVNRMRPYVFKLIHIFFASLCVLCGYIF